MPKFQRRTRLVREWITYWEYDYLIILALNQNRVSEGAQGVCAIYFYCDI